MDRDELLKIISRAKRNNATKLDLSHKGIESLPPEIGELKNLEYLDLSFNKLSLLPPEMAGLKNLKCLHLYDNQFTEFPEFIFDLNLDVFSFGNSGFKKFPSQIAKFSGLIDLAIVNVPLDPIPLEIFTLKKLTRLQLLNCSIQSIPREIGNLTDLVRLSLRFNNISRLPLELGKLTKLRGLNLSNTPLEFPPPEIIKQGAQAVVEYLASMAKGQQKHLREAKMIIVGQGGVGKTCLCNRLIEDRYEESPTTEGIAVRQWSLPAPDKSRTPMRINVWDFGGQEIYHATHQFFLTRRSLYVLVWDARAEDENGRIEYWLRIISTFGGDSRVALVINRYDDAALVDLNRKSYRDRFGAIIDFYRVSCKVPDKGKESFEQLTEDIAKSLWELPTMQEPWPMTWFAVREILENMADTRDFIPYSEYIAICKKYYIDNEDKADILSGFMHDLGIILHFQKDPELREWIILNPTWATEAVYKILSAKKYEPNPWKLSHNDLPEIWKEEDRYPRNTHRLLLRLMRNFELAFQMNCCDDYLIPELLPREAGEFKWNDKNNLVFEYHYDFMPISIMPRFIVRIHEDIHRDGDDYHCWREDVLLSRDGARAYVKSYQGVKNKIVIRVAGVHKREMLAIIRREFDHIHDTLKNIEVKRMVPCQCAPRCERMYDYNDLCIMEQEDEETTFCTNRRKKVSIARMLDGVESKVVREMRNRQTTIINGNVYYGNKIHNSAFDVEKFEELINVLQQIAFKMPDHDKLRDELITAIAHRDEDKSRSIFNQLKDSMGVTADGAALMGVAASSQQWITQAEALLKTMFNW